MNHNHFHSNMESIKNIIWSLKIPDSVKEDVLNVYKIIAEAESKAHNTSVSDIHFHEVGTKDAIMDITAFCLLIDIIKPDKIVAGPVCTGKGYVKCAHGILPVPTPATAYILEGIPTYQGDIEGELCTPTGAALLKYFVDEFKDQPTMQVEKIGYGMGKKDFEKLNCIRAFLGETENTKEKISILECNLDDMTGEEIGYATQILLDKGARDVYTTPIYMKKDRPGVILSVITDDEHKKDLVETIFKNTTTIGIREIDCDRYTLDREINSFSNSFGTFRRKKSKGYNSLHEKIEFDDLKIAAENNNLTLLELKEILKKSIK